MRKKKKQLKRNQRLKDAKDWVYEADQKSILVDYANKYSVDEPCAIIELEKLGFMFNNEYKKEVKKAYQRRVEENRKRNLARKNRTIEAANIEQDEHFAFIAGFTSTGFPYGITHEEMEDSRVEDVPDPNHELELYYETFEESFVTESHLHYIEQSDYTRDFEDICASLDQFYSNSTRQYYHHDPFHDTKYGKGKSFNLDDNDECLPF